MGWVCHILTFMLPRNYLMILPFLFRLLVFFLNIHFLLYIFQTLVYFLSFLTPSFLRWSLTVINIWFDLTSAHSMTFSPRMKSLLKILQENCRGSSQTVIKIKKEKKIKLKINCFIYFLLTPYPNKNMHCRDMLCQAGLRSSISMKNSNNKNNTRSRFWWLQEINSLPIISVQNGWPIIPITPTIKGKLTQLRKCIFYWQSVGNFVHKHLRGIFFPL